MAGSGHGDTTKAILYAFLANLGLAIAKTGAAIYTGSGSMMLKRFTLLPIAAIKFYYLSD